jgi:phage terminase large subunit-like protein
VDGSFHFTTRQIQAQGVMASDAAHIMLFGGSRSGKTFLAVRNVVMRAIKAPGSRHLIARFRFNHVKSSIILDTFPKVMSLCFPQVNYELSKTDWYAKLPNGAEIWFAGLDDKERTEKVLGLEFVTIYINECSQVSWTSRELLVTRLCQLVDQVIQDRPKVPMKPRMYYDCNPPGKGHWTYRLFKQKVNPETKEPIRDPDNYASFQMNPRDNAENLSPEYLKTLAGLSGRMRRRFEEGEFADENPNALFSESDIDKWRVIDGSVPQFVRVVVGVDPSGSGDEDNADNDEIGIAVAAIGTDGNAYVLEDCSCKVGPGTWGRIATNAFERHKADVVVGETNYGGDMVRATIQTARARTPFKKVTATRGKAVRAEPFSALYEQGKVRHVGVFSKLEDELAGFSTSGYMGQGSPNRADALIWSLTELFPALVEQRPDLGDFNAAFRRRA